MKSLLRNVKKSYGVQKMSEYDKEEEFEIFLLKMMEYNRNRVDYEIDDELFYKSIFDRDGNLIGFDWDR